ncbi:hypothetical protein FRC14_001573 [Serendipita sp. 396]|nr:hypothetical protein FRC14_001573 [Serendipita sp. 396]KAG8785187.1 hypothetical protein FRC15_001844 [Serendipita sp. 397]KAG8857877.1 hypothetical protein FRB91_010719 [Serendipita sp. 411]KAG8869528.1 hypothetical protein FRC20_001276 [Serendipita sp. 405]
MAHLFPELLAVVSDHPGTQNFLSVIFDATECITPKVLFDRVLNGLSSWTPDWEGGALNWASATGERYSGSFDAFVHGVRCIHREKMQNIGDKGGTAIIVLNAERLKDHIPALITPLSRLADLTELPVTVVFLSHLPWEEVRPAIGSSATPSCIYIPPLSSSDIVAHVQAQFTSLIDDSCVNPYHSILQPIFNSFVEIVHGICSPYMSDPLDMSYIVSTHWVMYISPIVNDWNYHNDTGEEYEIPPDAQTRLPSLFGRTIGTSVQQLHSRLTDATLWASQATPSAFSMRLSQMTRINIPPNRPDSEVTGFLSVTSLPIMARFLLVASYLASFNPIRMDSRILSQTRDPTKKFRKIANPKTRASSSLKIGPLLTGPTTFGFDRLWAISGALMEAFGTNEVLPGMKIHANSRGVSEAEVSRVHFLAQINNLISRKLLVRMTQEKLETQVMYKAAISMEQASALSDSIGFKLGPLLYEEVH